MANRIAARPHKGRQPPLNKRAFEMQFHWIFILIAGTLILAFFFNVAYKQKAISQEKLELTLATDIENIFTGAIVSTGTAQKLPAPPNGIEFECNEGCSCQFKISRAAKPFGDKAMFAPAYLAHQDLTVWALDLKVPYRATNLLYLTNPTIKYYLVKQAGNNFNEIHHTQITKNLPPLMQYENTTMADLPNIENEDYEQTKFIFITDDSIFQTPTLHKSFRKASTSAIKIDNIGVSFYKGDGQQLEWQTTLAYMGYPTWYAAMFAEDSTMYECGLKTAFRKLSYVSRLYAERAGELQQRATQAEKTWCDYGTGQPDACTSPTGPTLLLCEQHNLAKQLSTKIDSAQIGTLSTRTGLLDSANRNLIQQSCPELF